MRFAVLSLMLALSSAPAVSAPTVAPVNQGITAANLGIVVNDADPLSVQIGNLYAQMRKVPAANILHVNFKPGSTVMSPDQFKLMKQTLDAATPATVQAYLLTWVAPYRVGGMSITSAFALGYDVKYTSTTLCASTASTRYYNSTSTSPYTDFKIRPTMALGATSLVEAEALIQRGIASTHTRPSGTAYLMSTTDSRRNVRSSGYAGTEAMADPYVQTQTIVSNSLTYKTDVMFYFTGLERVQGLTTNKFLPGAVADHLTSYGGMLTDSPQMSALEWLKAGATASYGTVVEPCNYTAKYPNPKVMMQHYMSGQTVIEAYWKSVFWPGEGIFIGEPLARPFTGSKVNAGVTGGWSASFPIMAAGTYNVMVSGDPTQPYRLYRQASLQSAGSLNVTLANSSTARYRIERSGSYLTVDSSKVYTTVQ